MSRQPSALRPAPAHRGNCRTRIWVESPLQMLSAVESFASGLLGDSAELVARQGAANMAETAAELARLNLPDGLRLAGPATKPPAPPRDGTWAIGDAFSGLVQRRWLLSPSAGRVVLVDDGLATVHFLGLLAHAKPTPMVRARSRPGPLRQTLGQLAARRIRAAARAGDLTVFTAFAVNAELTRTLAGAGVRPIKHDFAWLRSQPHQDAPTDRLVVLGSSLAANGLVHAHRYVPWVRSLARQEKVAYYPHRHEDPRALGRLMEDPDISVHEAGAPVEMRLRGLGAGHRVISLPSTAVTSLRLLLGSTGASIEAFAVPDDWWTGRADQALRAHLNTAVCGAARPLERFGPEQPSGRIAQAGLRRRPTGSAAPLAIPPTAWTSGRRP